MLGLTLGVAGLLGLSFVSSASAVVRTRALDASNATAHSLNVSSCPGYTLLDLKNTTNGFTAALSLAGPECNAFGDDIATLALEVAYESQSRLHVHIYDAEQQQFQVPESVIARPCPDNSTDQNESDLEFHYNASPFEFWITRRSDPADAAPLFDTRKASLPPAPIAPLNASDNTTALDGFALVFEDQYLQLTSALPYNTNIYGLGEAVASSGIRRDVGVDNISDGGVGTIQALWAAGNANPLNGNMYGVHPVYMEHRYNETNATSKAHGVFLLNSEGMDVMLLTPPSSNTSLIQYRVLGGTLDLYFLSGPSPQEVVEQYGEVVGLPMWQSYWVFGFHLCRWGYANVSETREQVVRMREANIPLEVMWNDIDLYHAYRDFTTDPVNFPAEEVRDFIHELTSNHQHYIPIVDAAIPKATNSTDLYYPYLDGASREVFIKNPDGSEYIGQVWPGYTVFPDWFANNTLSWWTDSLRNWSESGVEFSGIWLDMNEPDAFCDGSCGTNANISNTTTSIILPGHPGNPVSEWPEGYNSTISGTSGNITVNGTLTYGAGQQNEATLSGLAKRGLGTVDEPDVNLNKPPYPIHNLAGGLSQDTVATNASSAPGYAQYDIHSLYGLMEERDTHLALQNIIPGKRPFMISRSTFASAGKWTGHWLGDNFSKWQYMYLSIQGILQFQLFQIPMVGADTCGFDGNTDEELCNRWMQLSAFAPFYRNHNIMAAISQEPYRWDSVANASRTAIGIRYSLLPYWYTLFANASMHGTPPVRALFWEFPDEPELFAIDRQLMIGRNILVTPVLEPNVSSVEGIFPGRGRVTWRDWYTHDVVNASSGTNTTLAAPLGHINVHVRDGAILLLHAQPGYTTTETRSGPYGLLVTLPLSSAGEESNNASSDVDVSAFGTAYIDDGATAPPLPNTTITFRADSGQLTSEPCGTYNITQKLTQIVILGVSASPSTVTLQGAELCNSSWTFDSSKGKLAVQGDGVEVDLNEPLTLKWA